MSTPEKRWPVHLDLAATTLAVNQDDDVVLSAEALDEFRCKRITSHAMVRVWRTGGLKLGERRLTRWLRAAMVEVDVEIQRQER